MEKKWGYTHLDISNFHTTLNLVEGERDAQGGFVYDMVDPSGAVISMPATGNNGYQTGFPYQDVNHFRVLSHTLIELNKGTVDFDIGYQNNKRKEFGDILNPTSAVLFFDLNTVNIHIKYNLQEINGWESSVGINSMGQINTNKGLEYLIPNYAFLDIGGFVFTQKSFNKLTLAGGLRYDIRTLDAKSLILDPNGMPTSDLTAPNSIKFNALDKNFSNISGSIGLTYKATKQSTLKLNLSRGFRAPNIAELTSNGKHEGAFRYVYGNPELSPEISHQIDVSYDVETPFITFTISPFANFISNYIYAEKMQNSMGADSIPDPSDPAPAFQYIQGNAVLLGGEIALNIHPKNIEWLQLNNVFSYVQATQNGQTDSTKYLPFIPPAKYVFEIKTQLAKLGKKYNTLYLKCGAAHYFAQQNVYSAYGTETPTPAYTLLNAGMGMHIKMRNKPDFITLYISGDNLADIAYQSHLSRLKYAPENPLTMNQGVYNMGRNFSVKLILNI